MLHMSSPGLIEKAKAQAEAAQHCHEGDHDMESAVQRQLPQVSTVGSIQQKYKTKYDEATQKQQSLTSKKSNIR